ncbi:putative bifunctional diguanylate cyclase/phosphodiesterase [Paeniglutamicibacter cryotolerans]|nr:EAL domain-containing protein [Paeniglutamicibacter cryotolerans]
MDHIEQAEAETWKLQRRLDRERRARLEAESIAEQGFRDLFEKNQQLLMLEAIADAANQADSITDALQSALRTVCRFTDWQVGHAYIVEESKEGPYLAPTSIWDRVEEESFHDFYLSTETLEFRPGAGLPGRVLASAEPVWIRDLALDSNFLRTATSGRAGLKSAAAFPILLGTEVTAVLEFFSNRVLELDETLMRLMAKIGTQLGRVVERNRAQEQLIHHAFHDPLTRLPNRALFADRLAHAVARSHRHGEDKFAVLFIDLDRFKLVNDSLGHPAGDDLIVQVAERLRACLREEDTLARMGGDEYTVLLDSIEDVNDAMRIAERLISAFQEHFVIAGEELFASASIGIATSTGGGETAPEILRHADLAMYRAKSLGKGRFELYDPGMHELAASRLALENRLRRALHENEFVVHYQPIISLSEGGIVGVEALVRWRKSETELVYPDGFISVAEETGLILFLGMWVLREACSTMVRWHKEFPRTPELTVSINVSALQFAQNDFVQQVSKVLRETGIRPETVSLEITESVSMTNSEHTMTVLARLRALGVRISIDDFGTGYSSLAYLHRFQLDTLKIDRSFVAQLDDSKEGLHVVQSIMDLAQNLGLNVVAEGAENARHVAQLTAMGCEFAQGFYYSRPVEAGALSALLEEQGQQPNSIVA